MVADQADGYVASKLWGYPSGLGDGNLQMTHPEPPKGGPALGVEPRPLRTTVESQKKASWNRVPELDGLRGLAVLGVLVFHFLQMSPFARILPESATRVMVTGQWGVDLFFVLSGFLITTILLGTRTEKGYFRKFYIRRSVRIFPLYFAWLGFVAVWAICTSPSGFPGWAALLPYALFYANLAGFFVGEGPYAFYVPYHEHVGHFWSLAVEEHFYMVWPLIVYFLSRWTLALALVGCIVLSCILRALMPEPEFPVFYFTPTRLDGLCMGSLLALAVSDIWDRKPTTTLAMLWRMAAVVCLGVIVSALVFVGTASADGYRSAITAAKYPIVATVFTALLGASIFLPPQSILRRCLRLKALIFLGTYSYGLYVLHPFIYHYAIEMSFVDWAKSGSLFHLCLGLSLQATLVLALSCVAAFLLYHGFEAKFLALKKYAEYARPSRVPSVASVMSQGRSIGAPVDGK